MRVERSTVNFVGRSFKLREVGECQSVEVRIPIAIGGMLEVLTVGRKENNVGEITYRSPYR
jgi:hypothetical protein